MSRMFERPSVWVATATLAALGAYGIVLGAFFVSDDFSHLAILGSRGAAGLWCGGGVFLRPLTSVSLAADHALWGLRPAFYHVHNVLLHALCSVLVGLLVHGLARRSRDPENERGALRAAVLAAALFLVAPSHAEAVAWVSGRCDLLAALLALASLVAWLGWERSRRSVWLVLSAASYAGALASKESAAALPLIIGALIRWRRPAADAERAVRNDALFILPHAAVLGAYLAARVGLLEHPFRPPGGGLPGPGAFIETVFIDGAKSLLAYWPGWLLGVRGTLRQYDAGPTVVIAFTATAGFLVARSLFGTQRHRFGQVRFAALGWILAMLPAISLPTRLFTSESDRFLYFPSAFVAMALAWLVTILAPSRRGWRLAGGALLVLYFGLLQRVNLNWRWAGDTTRRMVGDAVADARETYVAVCVPDNLRGAYVFRNGFAEAVALFSPPGRAGRAWALSTIELQHVSDGVEVRERDRIYELHPRGPTAPFMRTGSAPPDCVTLTSSASGAQLRLDDGCTPAARLFVYCEGGLVSLGTCPGPGAAKSSAGSGPHLDRVGAPTRRDRVARVSA